MLLKNMSRFFFCGSVEVFVLLLSSGVGSQRTSRPPEELLNSTETAAAEYPGLVSLNPKNVTEVQTKFPGYFLTPADQERLERANEGFLTPTPVANVSRNYGRCFTNHYCERQNPQSLRTTTTATIDTNRWSSYDAVNTNLNVRARRRRQVSSAEACSLDSYDQDELTFHGCCVSISSLQKPSTLPTAEPDRTGNVVVAQFRWLKQYFEIQQCCQARNCTGCQCSQTHYVVSAVIRVRMGHLLFYKVGFVRVPGCCKCLNVVAN